MLVHSGPYFIGVMVTMDSVGFLTLNFGDTGFCVITCQCDCLIVFLIVSVLALTVKPGNHKGNLLFCCVGFKVITVNPVVVSLLWKQFEGQEETLGGGRTRGGRTREQRRKNQKTEEAEAEN